MADKKVERGFRPVSPTQKMEAALSDPGTRTMNETTHDKQGKSALAEKFRQREERWRTEQALRDQASAHNRRGRVAAAEEETGQEAEAEPGADRRAPVADDQAEQR